MHHIEKCARSSFHRHAVAHLEHVGIVPVPGPAYFRRPSCLSNDFAKRPIDTRFCGLFCNRSSCRMSPGGAPGMADIGGPEPRLIIAPFAQAEEDRPNRPHTGRRAWSYRLPPPSGPRHCTSHISGNPFPSGVSLRVLKFVTPAGWPATAGFVADIRIDAELQSLWRGHSRPALFIPDGNFFGSGWMNPWASRCPCPAIVQC